MAAVDPLDAYWDLNKKKKIAKEIDRIFQSLKMVLFGLHILHCVLIVKLHLIELINNAIKHNTNVG